MRSPLRRRSTLAALLLALPLFAFSQGLTWETTTTIGAAGEHSLQSTSYYLPRMFKQMTESEATIFRLDRQVLYTIDYAKKEYSEMTFAELEAYVKKAQGEFASQMAELKKHLEGMPAEARKQMEQMMGSQPGAGGGGKADRVEVKKSPGTKAIGGFSCTRYELTQEGKELGSVWTTTKVPGVSGMQKDLKEFGERMASQMTANGPQMAQAMRAVEGFPMETSIGGMTATVTKVAEAAVAKSDFDVPAGFKKVPFAGRERRRRGDPMDEETNDEE